MATPAQEGGESVMAISQQDNITNQVTPSNDGVDTTEAPPCRLLDLPKELRDMIYDKILEEEPPILTRKKMTTLSTLLRTNKQIYNEVTDRIFFGPQPIRTTVVNFNFAHIVTFLNRLPDNFIERMTPDEDEEKPAKKVLEIELHLYEDSKFFLDKLRRWLNRLATEKKGVGIETRFTVPSRFYGRKVPTLGTLWGLANQHYHDKEVPLREIRKIEDAVKAMVRPPRWVEPWPWWY